MFAYLAVRSIKKLPISIPSTTGVNHPISGGILITPSSLPYEEMQSNDLVAIDCFGNSLREDQRKPSSEWRLHLDVYI